MPPGFVEVAKARETAFIFGTGEKAPEGLRDFDFEDANGVRHINVGEQPTHF